MILKATLVFLGFSICSLVYGQLPDSVKVSDLNHFRISLRHDRFSRNLDQWSTGSFQYKFSSGSFQFMPQITVSERFDRTGTMATLDVYKTFINEDYINVSGAISTNSIFPQYRATVHYFNPFGTWENSFGLTYSHFDNFGDLFTVIAGISKYHSNWLSTLRVYFAIQPDEQINNLSFYTENRYYLSNYSYFSLSFKYGFDTNFISVIDNADQPGNVSSVLYGAGLAYDSEIRNYFQWKLMLEWSRFDFAFSDRDQYSLSLLLTKYRR